MPNKKSGPKKEHVYPILTALGLVILVFSILWYLLPSLKGGPASSIWSGTLDSQIKKGKLERFRSEKEFKDYLAQSARLNFAPDLGTRSLTAEPLERNGFAKQAAPGGSSDQSVDRYSGTNVQVKGIDEPDILKTNGQEIFYSSPQTVYSPMMEPELIEKKFAPQMPQHNSGISSIKAFPPENLELESTIDKSGDLLLSEKTLIIIADSRIYGYDLSNPVNPSQKWTLSLKENNQIVASRLYQNNLYLIQKTGINSSRPCPIEILSGPKGITRIPCLDIHHPIASTPVDVTYTSLIINSETGAVSKTISFVGSSSTSAIYMSKNFLYATYYYPGDIIGLFYNFFLENKDLVGMEVTAKLGRLRSYDLSPSTKMAELSVIIEQYLSSLGDDDRLKQQNEISNRLSAYAKEHKREVDATGIVKISLSDFNLTATGTVPGQLHNQFSLDEYQENLRVATTVGASAWGWGFGFGSSNESANDVYVLDQKLSTLGKVTDLGKTERIYSVRFVEDKAYLVTFRQTDPFYVLDLTNPRNPQLSGELKIPGFSSYLHPITKDLILGVGQESGKVKLSLFDVSDPTDPIEKDKYQLDDYYSEVQSNYHAFQIDRKFNIFFLPGSQGGYIFSYSDEKLELIKAISTVAARRAVYINDYLYIVGDNAVVVLNEKDWEKVNELEL